MVNFTVNFISKFNRECTELGVFGLTIISCVIYRQILAYCEVVSEVIASQVKQFLSNVFQI